MELYQLKQFVAVAETGSMTQAAEQLYLSQPNISRSIKRLEQELGMQLFIRERNKMVLNENGEFILSHARAALEEVYKIQNAHSVLYPHNHLIFAGVGSIYFDMMVPEMLGRFPKLTLEVRTEKSYEDMFSAFQNDLSHLVLGNLEHTGPDVVREFFLRERLCISVPSSHPFFERDCLHLEDLQGQDFILSTNAESNYSNNLLREHDIHVNAVYTTDQPVSESKAFNSHVLVFESSVCNMVHRIVSYRKLIPLADEDASFDVFLFYKKKNRALCAPFVAALKELFGRIY